MTDKLTPPEEEITAEEAILALSKMVEEPDTTATAKGACVYNAASKTYCAVLTKAECNQLKGTWYEGKKCP